MTTSLNPALRSGNWSQFRKASNTVVGDKQRGLFQDSIIPTRHFQKSLPRLPIPSLSHTQERYLEAIQPIVSPHSFSKTEKLFQNFIHHEGSRVNEELIGTDRANLHTSFISSDWFEKSLKSRSPIPLHQYTSIVVRHDEDKEDMLVRAAYWCFASVVFYQKYLDDVLPPCVVEKSPQGYWRSDWFEKTVSLCPEYFSATMMTAGSNKNLLPVDLSQGDNLFNSTRVPGILQDEIRAVGFMPHIIVQYKGKQFSVNVADNERNPLPVEKIYAHLKSITESTFASEDAEISVLTSLPRNEWNALRTALIRDPVNQASLEEVETSMFILNLDGDVEVDFCSAAGAVDPTFAVRNTNRWWDKSLSVSVSRKGVLTVGFENSWGDGTFVRHYIDLVSQFTASVSSQQLQRTATVDGARCLQWRLNREILDAMTTAKQRLTNDIEKLDVCTEVITSRFPLENIASIDSLVQIAVQLAWWQSYSSLVNSTERVDLSHFLRGRCGYLRALSKDCESFVVAVSRQNTLGTSECRSLFEKSIAVYDQREAEVKNGMGPDAHLFGLCNMYLRMTGKLAPVFQDSSYLSFVEPVLHTEPVLKNSGSLLEGFFPTLSGYGIRFSLLDEVTLVISVSNWKAIYGPNRSSREFNESIQSALSQIVSLYSVE